MRKIIRLIALLVVLIVIGVVVAFIYVDSIAKTAVERGGTYAMGVNTTLDGAQVGILRGEFRMNGLNIANPQAFDAPHFLAIKRGGVDVAIGTLLKETVNVAQFRLNDVDVHLQKRGDTSNYQVILDNLNRFEESGDKTPGDEQDGKRFIVDRVVIRNVMVHVDMLPQGGSLTKIDLPVDRVVLKGVGSDTERGLLLSELAKVIVQAVFAAIIEQGAGIIPAEMLGDLRNQLAQLTDLSKLGISFDAELPENINEILREQGLEGIGDVLRDGGDRIREAGEGLRNIIGGGGGQ